MDHLDEHLATATVGHKYDPAIKAAIGVGKRTLNRYYDRTDHSELYRIAMSKSFLFFFHAPLLIIFSLTPSPQVLLLPPCWMDTRVDCSREEDHS
jgi:hypothetical protein